MIRYNGRMYFTATCLSKYYPITQHTINTWAAMGRIKRFTDFDSLCRSIDYALTMDSIAGRTYVDLEDFEDLLHIPLNLRPKQIQQMIDGTFDYEYPE